MIINKTHKQIHMNMNIEHIPRLSIKILQGTSELRGVDVIAITLLPSHGDDTNNIKIYLKIPKLGHHSLIRTITHYVSFGPV